MPLTRGGLPVSCAFRDTELQRDSRVFEPHERQVPVIVRDCRQRSDDVWREVCLEPIEIIGVHEEIEIHERTGRAP